VVRGEPSSRLAWHRCPLHRRHRGDAETVTLYAWDSGTNAARTYKAEKVAVDPFVGIALSDAPMFNQGSNRKPIGTAAIRKVSS
jgi:hypothetical protein